ncbi:MAG: helix-turn-helix transcriptional regulator [Deltaproteobacteria bacterium]|nr:helix-turn-helix transcriptional regulator [Deltaproteobacteria bacterium]
MFDFGKNAFPGMPRGPISTRMELDFGEFRLRLGIESTLTKQQRRAIALAVIRELAPLWHIRKSVIRHEDDAYRDVPHYMVRPTSMAQAPSFHTARDRYGMRIRLARQARGLTQACAAALLKMNVAHLSQVERAKHIPRLDLRERIKDLLQVELESRPDPKSKVQNVASTREAQLASASKDVPGNPG